MTENCNLILGDCLEKVNELENNSIDLCLTDPPYGLEFMGKGWDKWQESFNEKWAAAIIPKLKAGAFLVFTMTPRQDLLWRCLAGMEKAGFELKGSGMYWLYHTGFPKAADMSKAIDKRLKINHLFEPFAKHYKEQRINSKLTHKQICDKGKFYDKINHGGASSNWELGLNVPTKEQWIILKNILKLSDNFLPLIERIEAERNLIGKSDTTIGVGGSSPRMGGEHDITEPINELSKTWNGWKSYSLKPAVECVVVAQKPRTEKTIVGQVLATGTGAVNVGDCRIPYASENDDTHRGFVKDGNDLPETEFNKNFDLKSYDSDKYHSQQGRFPANLLVSGEPLSNGSNRFYSLDKWAEKNNIALTEDFAFLDVPKPSKAEKNEGLEGFEEKFASNLPMRSGDKDVDERVGEGQRKTDRQTKSRNQHPTCKPVTLFSYLAKMFCQPKGVILDPFMGSGTTGIAALKMNFKFIGIEKEEDYFKIAQARIKSYSEQMKLMAE